MATPVHVIAGFLGTGKTTTLTRLLAARPAGEKVAVIVNDFGEAAVDATVVDEASGVRIAEIRGACVCCTAPEDFVGALGLLLDDVRPDRIFVEPTGLARPADLVDTLRRGPHRDRVAVAPVIVLVDPRALDPDDPLQRDQAEAADVLVANRVDLAEEDDLAKFDSFACTLWPGPMRVIRTRFGELTDDVLHWPEGQGPRAAPREHDHAHDHDAACEVCGPSTVGHVARSATWGPDVTFSRARLEAALTRAIADGVPLARVKGLFRTDEGTLLVEVAGGRVHARPSPYRRDSRADVIVRGDTAALDAVFSGLSAARSTDEEARIDRERLEVVRPDGTRRGFDRDALRALPGGVPDVGALVPKRRGEAARVAEILRAAGVALDGSAVVVAADGLTTPPVPADALATAVLVHTLDGGPLPADQGGPYRLLIPGDAGPGGACANVKGAVRIVIR